MPQSEIISATFKISSRALCFGPLGDILKGAESPIQEPPETRPHLGGTVMYHPLEYNVAARNGVWNAYKLLDVATSSVEGWFAASADMEDPLQELTRILRLCGSPYEHDSGSSKNNEKTREEQVLVINRYDWGMEYDREKVPDEVAEGHRDPGANGNTIGLVDYAHGSEYVQRWARQKPSERGASSEGTWMYIPDAEYMFGRISFDDEYTEARTFLFFTQRTDFFKTKFPGQSEPLRKYEKNLDRLQRIMREGVDLCGIDLLRERYTPPPPELQIPERPWDARQPPPDSELLGPYGVSEHIFNGQNLKTLLLYRPGLDNNSAQVLLAHNPDNQFRITQFQRRNPSILIEPWETQVGDLLNELILSFLEHDVLPHRSHSTPSSAGPAIFPNATAGGSKSRPRKHLDAFLLSIFEGTRPFPVTRLDVSSAGARVGEFLTRRAGDTPVALNKECLERIARVAAYFITEIIELADNYALDCQILTMEPFVRPQEDTYILPQYVRSLIYHNDQLDRVQYSTSYWKGTGREQRQNAEFMGQEELR